MIFKYCAECGHKLENIKCGDDDCKICPCCKKIYGSNPFPVVEVLVVNEFNEILLLKQNYISEDKWTVVSGYMIDGETIEDAVAREVKEETGQDVIRCKYISSYYFAPKQLIMIGFIAYVKKSRFSNSDEVDDIKWPRSSWKKRDWNFWAGVMLPYFRRYLGKRRWSVCRISCRLL